MEFKTVKEPVSCGRMAYDSFVEQAVEGDILLPDYLPDVIMVLCCHAEPRIMSCQGDGRKITLDGVTMLSLSYASEDGRIHTVQQKLPFSKTVETRTDILNPVFSVDTRVDYLNCRAVSKRRIDIRGAFTTGIKVLIFMDEDAVADASGSGIQLKHETINSIYPLGECRRQTTVREELELGYEKAAAISIIRSSARCTAADCKVVAGKIVAKSEVWLHVLYDTENDGMQSMDYSIPVSQIVDMENLTEESICDVRFEVAAVDVHLSGTETAEHGGMMAEITLMTVAKVMNVCSASVVSDAYSTICDSRTDAAKIMYISKAESIDMHTSVREMQTLPEDAADIRDVWCEVRSWECKNTENGVEAECHIMIRLMAVDAQGMPVYYEKPASFIWNRTVDASAVCDIAFVITGCSYTRDGTNSLDIRIEADVAGMIYNIRTAEALTGIVLSDEPDSAEKDEAALTICYACDGEEIWDIAKRYRAPVDAVMEENALEAEKVPEHMMLLIPMT